MTVQEEEGFTLVELVIAVFILTLVVSTVTAAFVAGTQATTRDMDRVLSSTDAAFTSAWLTKDVQSARTVSTAAAECSTPATDLVVALSWSGPDEKVDYRYSVVDGTGQLERVSCGTTPRTDVVARYLLAKPSATCGSPCRSVELQLSGKDGAAFTISASRRTA
jgi:Tfp pilus assembly protein PilE